MHASDECRTGKLQNCSKLVAAMAGAPAWLYEMRMAEPDLSMGSAAPGAALDASSNAAVEPCSGHSADEENVVDNSIVAWAL